MENIVTLINASEPTISEYDDWYLVESFEDSSAMFPKSMLVVPFESWLDSPNKHLLSEPLAFWLSNDTDVHLLEPWLDRIKLIALHFPKFTDGRAYSQAVELRTRLNWKGDIRAFGDVLRDQLSHMQRCGFSSFAVREDKDVEDAIKGLSSMSTRYSGSAVEPKPLFRRRSAN